MPDLPPDRWDRINALFSDALELPAPERENFLRTAAAGDEELLKAVRVLLASDAEAARVLGESATGFAAPLLRLEANEPDEAVEATEVGPYRLIREIGRGGMGTVYLAERADRQFERRVAVKRVKRGLDTDEVLQRFRYERQILASLQHPNIAALFDGGATEDGRPYLVMEYVDGQPIDRFCDSMRLEVEARLALFRTVCRAVQHAHGSLVVHRDLKPSNILVTAEGVPKLLDFGIAKLLDEVPADGSPHTRTGVRVLTPEYASPEQIDGGPVTTASDVYALGVVLFQLLTGRRPFERDERGRTTPARRAADTLPDRPSTVAARAAGALGASGPARTPHEVAAARSTTPDRLRRRLAGDLDTVVLKALAPEPGRRYPSVQALLDDLERHLAGRPVSARADTLAYRAGKFLRRHRAGVAAAAAIVLSLTGGMGVAMWQAEQAARERDTAEQVTAFLEGLFRASNPFAAQPERLDTLRVAALLERGVARVESDTALQPAVQARMLATLGEVYRGMGQTDRAQPLLERALALRAGVHGPVHADVASSQVGLGMLLRQRGDHETAEPLLREALATRRRLLGGAHPSVAEALHELGTLLRFTRRRSEAEDLLRESVAIRRGLPGPRDELAAGLLGLSALAGDRGDHAEAERLGRESISLHRSVYGEDHPKLATALLSLATLLEQDGRVDAARPLVEESIRIYGGATGTPHPHLPSALDLLARVQLGVGRAAEAEPAARESLRLRLGAFGDRHPAVLPGYATLGTVLRARGRPAEAEPLFRRAVEVSRELPSLDARRAAIPLGNLAGLLVEQGRCPEAEPLLREVIALQAHPVPPDSATVGSARAGLEACGAPGRPVSPPTALSSAG